MLVDPWLVGPLEFFEAGWLYRGTKRGLGQGVAIDVGDVAAETDVILITQVRRGGGAGSGSRPAGQEGKAGRWVMGQGRGGVGWRQRATSSSSHK